MHSPLEQFKIKKILPLELFGYDISFTNSSLMMLIILAIIGAVALLTTRRPALIPGRLQVLGESIYGLVHDMVSSTCGAKGEKFVPFIMTLFLFILTANLLGMIPGSFTITSHIAVTFGLAAVIFIGITIIGFIVQGFGFLRLFLPEGTPGFMAPLIIFIEFFAFLARPVSLSIRLMANMTAGHIILKILASMIIMSGIMIKFFPLVLLTVITGFEFFIAILQAYIFTILTCVYLNDALHSH